MHPLKKFEPVARAVADLFGPHTEVIIHDIATDKVFAVINGFSGRKAGDPSDLGLEGDRESLSQDVLGPYEKMGAQGQRISSISAVLREDDGVPVGLLCINADYSWYRAAFEVLEHLLSPPRIEQRPEVLFRNEWQDVIREEVKRFMDGRARPGDTLPPRARRELLRAIDDKGLLYARKAVDQLAAILKVSRSTLYKDLTHIRDNDPLKAVL